MADFPNPFTRTGVGGILGAGGVTPFADYADLANTGYSVTATTWGTANRAVYQPCLLSDRAIVTQMVVTVQTQAGNLDVGIYDFNDVRRVSSGSTAVGAAGVQIVDITDTELEPGWYKLAFACDSTTAAFRGTAIATPIMRACGVQQQLSAFALPSTATPATYATAIAPLVIATYRTAI